MLKEPLEDWFKLAKQSKINITSKSIPKSLNRKPKKENVQPPRIEIGYTSHDTIFSSI